MFPVLVRSSIEAIEEFGVGAEGIYRRGGNYRRIAMLREGFDNGIVEDMTASTRASRYPE